MNRNNRLFPAYEALQAARDTRTQAGNADMLVNDLDALSLMCAALSDITLNIAEGATWATNALGKPYSRYPELGQDLKVAVSKLNRLSNNLAGISGDARRIKTEVDRKQWQEGT